MRKHRLTIVLLSGLLVLLGIILWPRASERVAQQPAIMLWAWERPEELSRIDPREVGVAFLAKTLILRGDSQIIIRPRLQPLRVPPATYLMAVARIETDPRVRPALSSAQREEIVAEIAMLADKPAIAAVQVDFDAKLSERAFYRDLLHELRQRLPAAVMLSMTALASWCLHDDWLTGLPVDEAVPMLFRMGVDRPQVLLDWQASGDFRPVIARRSLGIATDEPLLRLPRGRRLYLFRPRAWSSEAALQAIHEVRNWP